MAAATMVGQITDKAVDGRKIGHVTDELALFRGMNQTRVQQRLEMERQGGRSDGLFKRQALGDPADHHAFRAGLDQLAKNRQAAGLAQSAQGQHGPIKIAAYFHNYRIIEI